MGNYSIVISLFLMGTVLIFELLRPKLYKVDYLSAINFVFLLAFGVVPTYIILFYKQMTWSTIFYNHISEPAFLFGSLLSVLFYISVVFTYYFTGKIKFVNKLESFSGKLFTETKDKEYFKVAFILFLVGGSSLIVYMNILGGFSEYIRLGPLLRSSGSYFQHPLMFLKNITPLLTIAAFIMYALFKRSKKFTKFMYFTFFIISFLGGSLVVFHSSGRMTLFLFLITIPVAEIIYKNKIKISTLVSTSLLFLFIVLFGGRIMNVNESPSAQSLPEENFLTAIIQEFSFPFTNIANNIILFPAQYSFRGGIGDILKGFSDILPNQLLFFDFFKGENATSFNTNQFGAAGTLPIDILSFGYVSFGIAGVMIVGILLGFSARFTEILFSYRGNIIASIFYVNWMFFFAFRIMYGDPGHAYASSFELIVAVLLILLVVNKGNKVQKTEKQMNF